MPAPSNEFIEECIQFCRRYQEAKSSVDEDATQAVSLELTVTTTSSATSYTPDLHAVSIAEAQSYYAGLHSEPTLLYRTGKEQWT